MIRPPPSSTPFPYTTLFRSLAVGHFHGGGDDSHRAVHGHLHALHPPGPHWRGVGDRLRAADAGHHRRPVRSEEHTSELQSQSNLVCRLLLEKKKNLSHVLRR